MDYTTLTRDPKRVFNSLKELEDGSVIALHPIEVHFPSGFLDRNLASIGKDVESIMVLGLVLPSGEFASIFTQAEVTLSPTNIREETIAGNRYTILEFEKGDTVFHNLTVVRNEHLNNPYYKEFTYYGRIPWYIDADSLPGMFDHCQEVTGRSVGETPQVYRVLYGLANRDPENIEVPYRYSVSMAKGFKPHVIGLNNGSMLIDGTFNHLMGGYLQDNIIEAILNPDTRVTDAEKVMRGTPD